MQRVLRNRKLNMTYAQLGGFPLEPAAQDQLLPSTRGFQFNFAKKPEVTSGNAKGFQRRFLRGKAGGISQCRMITGLAVHDFRLREDAITETPVTTGERFAEAAVLNEVNA